MNKLWNRQRDFLIPSHAYLCAPKMSLTCWQRPLYKCWTLGYLSLFCSIKMSYALTECMRQWLSSKFFTDEYIMHQWVPLNFLTSKMCKYNIPIKGKVPTSWRKHTCSSISFRTIHCILPWSSLNHMVLLSLANHTEAICILLPRMLCVQVFHHI